MSPTRNGKLRRLDLDTLKLLELSKFRVVDYHQAILFSKHKQMTLDGNIKEKIKGRISFFKRLSHQKGNIVADHEDILIAVRGVEYESTNRIS